MRVNKTCRATIVCGSIWLRTLAILSIILLIMPAPAQSSKKIDYLNHLKDRIRAAETPSELFTSTLDVGSGYVFDLFDPDSAVHYLNRAAICKNLTIEEQSRLHVIWINYYARSQPVNALPHIDSVTTLLTQHKDSLSDLDRISIRHNIALFHLMSQDYPSAEKEFLWIIDSMRNHPTERIRDEVGYNYMFLSEISQHLNDTTNALRYADSSVAAYYRGSLDSNYLNYVHSARASIYYKYGLVEEALTEVLRAFTFGKSYASGVSTYVLCLKDLGRHEEVVEQAKNFLFEEGYSSIVSIEHLAEIAEVAQASAEVLGKHNMRVKFLEAALAYKDQLIGEDKGLDELKKYIGQLREQNAELALKQKDQEIALEKAREQRQRIMLFALIGGLLMTIIFVIFVFNRLQLTRKQNRIIEAERARSEELLLNILPEEVAEELKDTGTAESKLIDQVTVLFTDFKGFTALSEQLSPKELVQDLNECFSAFDAITVKYGIEKIKTIGDAYMAAGGLPSPNITHAEDVVMAALEMRDFVETGKLKKITKGLPYFQIRIGVHTGPVVAGIVGVKKFQYDIWGDTVNIASRMESSGHIGQVNISETTHRLLKDNSQFTFEHRGKVEAKGKGEMEMYFVSKI